MTFCKKGTSRRCSGWRAAESRGGAAKANATRTFSPDRKPLWLTVLFEMQRPRYALTVDGKTITYDCPVGEETEIDKIRIRPEYNRSAIFAIDDVKVWEALPKDEEDGKWKKRK